MAATYKDIRRLTGLSLATISKYFNGGNVKAANRELIEKAVDELGFVTNDFARGLRSRRSMAIGVVLADLNSVFYTSVVSNMEERLREAGYSTIITNSRGNARAEEQAIGFLLGKMVDGIVIVPVGDHVGGLDMAQARGVPVVAVDRLIANAEVDAVVVDNADAIASAVELLTAAGHTSIALLDGPDDVYTMRERRRGFKMAIKSATGRDPGADLTKPGPFTVEGGHDGLLRLMRLSPSPTAVVCANYELTLGAIIARNELGDDAAAPVIVGFDNLELSRIVRPRPTVVAQPIAKIATTAAELLLERLAGVLPDGPRVILCRTELVVGEPIPPPFGAGSN